jgi:hypothetical protein
MKDASMTILKYITNLPDFIGLYKFYAKLHDNNCMNLF